MYCTVIICY